MRAGARRVASWVALVVVALVVGAAVYAAARDDPAPPPTTTTTTTATPGAPREAVVEAVAEELQASLPVDVTASEARCLADGLVDVVPGPVLEALAERDEPLTGVSPEDREVLVRIVVGCVRDEAAAALLGRATTTTAVAGLPDEG